MAVIAADRAAVHSQQQIGSATRASSNTAWRRFTRDRIAVGALGVILLIVALAVIAPAIAPDPTAIDLDAIKKPPTLEHPLGTDSAGRDVWARLLHGARVSMSVGLVAVGIATLIGTLI